VQYELRSCDRRQGASTFFSLVILVTTKEKLIKAASVILSAAGLSWTIATSIGNAAANLDHRLDLVEQRLAALSAEVRLIDRDGRSPR
jgi:hypothetical protein